MPNILQFVLLAVASVLLVWSLWSFVRHLVSRSRKKKKGSETATAVDDIEKKGDKEE